MKESRLDRFLNKLKNKYRLVVLNDETFEERASFRLSRFNVYVFVTTVALLLISITFSLIVFTPLKTYIPGYADVGLRLRQMKQMEDIRTLQDSMATLQTHAEIVLSTLRGQVDTTAGLQAGGITFDETQELDRIPIEDVLLREEVEREESFAVNGVMGEFNLKNLNLSNPMEGVLTNNFDPKEKHFGIDISGAEKAPIKAVLDGTVILASWTLETGYVIAIQHDFDLISFYKHNSVLLKEVGNFVKSGEVVAIVGNSGEFSNGPHLHFELWHKGLPVDPEGYMLLN